MEAGFESILGWEYLYVLEQLAVFLSVDADDFKMAGKKGKPCKNLDLKPAIKMDQNVYLAEVVARQQAAAPR